MRLVFLDSGPLGLLAHPRAGPDGVRCRRWVVDLTAAGVRVMVPEICDYEIRREMLRRKATAGIRRLDQVKATLEFVPIVTDAMLRAAELWAMVRRAGLPTAADAALDGDCILAAQALTAAGPSDVATVATDNVGHLVRFGLDAREWDQIMP